MDRAKVLPLQLHTYLARHPSSKIYQDVVMSLGREITTFCNEVRELISWWISDLPSPQAYTDIDRLVDQSHVAFDKVDGLVLVNGRWKDEYEDDYWQGSLPEDEDLERNLQYISAYIHAVARTFHVMTDTFRIAETIRDDQLVLQLGGHHKLTRSRNANNSLQLSQEKQKLQSSVVDQQMALIKASRLSEEVQSFFQRVSEVDISSRRSENMEFGSGDLKIVVLLRFQERSLLKNNYPTTTDSQCIKDAWNVAAKQVNELLSRWTESSQSQSSPRENRDRKDSQRRSSQQINSQPKDEKMNKQTLTANFLAASPTSYAIDPSAFANVSASAFEDAYAQSLPGEVHQPSPMASPLVGDQRYSYGVPPGLGTSMPTVTGMALDPRYAHQMSGALPHPVAPPMARGFSSPAVPYGGQPPDKPPPRQARRSSFMEPPQWHHQPLHPQYPQAPPAQHPSLPEASASKLAHRPRSSSVASARSATSSRSGGSRAPPHRPPLNIEWALLVDKSKWEFQDEELVKTNHTRDAAWARDHARARTRIRTNYVLEDALRATSWRYKQVWVVDPAASDERAGMWHWVIYRALRYKDILRLINRSADLAKIEKRKKMERERARDERGRGKDERERGRGVRYDEEDDEDSGRERAKRTYAKSPHPAGRRRRSSSRPAADGRSGTSEASARASTAGRSDGGGGGSGSAGRQPDRRRSSILKRRESNLRPEAEPEGRSHARSDAAATARSDRPRESGAREPEARDAAPRASRRESSRRREGGGGGGGDRDRDRDRERDRERERGRERRDERENEVAGGDDRRRNRSRSLVNRGVRAAQGFGATVGAVSLASMLIKTALDR
jgi:hypothetical protein